MKVDHKTSLHDSGNVRVIRPREITISFQYLFLWKQQPHSRLGSHHQGFTIILRHTTLDRTPLDESPASRRDLYLTTHSTHKRQSSSCGVRTRNPCKTATASPCLRMRGHGYRHCI